MTIDIQIPDVTAPDTPAPAEGTREFRADRIQKFFIRPFFLCLTIGIPFCIFKMLFGLVAMRAGDPRNPVFFILGSGIVVWAACDLSMNTGRLILDFLGKPAGFEYCTIAQLGRLVLRPMLFLAVDTFLAFSIICAMLWSGWITRLSGPESVFWYAATTLNLVSLSLVTLYNEIRKGSDEKRLI